MIRGAVALWAGCGVACAPALVPWSGGGTPAERAAERAVADAAELWIAADALPPESQGRAARQVLEQLARLSDEPLSRPFAVDARLLQRDAQLYLARDARVPIRYAIEHGRPMPEPESFATMRACLAQVLSSTPTALGTCGSPSADVSLPTTETPDPTLDELWARTRSSPDAASPIRQATADARVAAAWRLVLEERDARAHTGSSTTAREAVGRAVRAALTELGRYAPGDAAYTLDCALTLLDPGPQGHPDLRARLRYSADQGLLPPWILDVRAAEASGDELRADVHPLY